jgi:hypothetical protein
MLRSALLRPPPQESRHARKSGCDGQSCQTRTTQHYERRRDEVILDKLERIAI